MNGEWYKECTVCGSWAETGSIPALGHDPGDFEVIQTKKCSGGNEISGRVCKRCYTVLETKYTESNARLHTLKRQELSNGSIVDKCIYCGEILYTYATGKPAPYPTPYTTGTPSPSINNPINSPIVTEQAKQSITTGTPSETTAQDPINDRVRRWKESTSSLSEEVEQVPGNLITLPDNTSFTQEPIDRVYLNNTYLEIFFLPQNDTINPIRFTEQMALLPDNQKALSLKVEESEEVPSHLVLNHESLKALSDAGVSVILLGRSESLVSVSIPDLLESLIEMQEKGYLVIVDTLTGEVTILNESGLII